MLSRRIYPLLKRSFQFVSLGVMLIVTAQYILVINTTRSFPLGIYLKTYGPIHWGDIVLMCPEDNEVSRFGRERGLISYGVCPSRFGYLIKRVEALDGDRVDFSRDAIRVNGLPLKNSSRQQAIPARVDGAVELHHQALLMSEHPLSFDSRYFGPVSTDTLCTPLKPLIVWE